MTHFLTKQILRENLSLIRDNFSTDALSLEKLVTNFKNTYLSLGISSSDKVALYSAIKSEVPCEILLLHLQKEQIVFPKVVDNTKVLKFCQGDMQRGTFSILEPKGTQEFLPKVIITPLLGFDEKCNRLGYGKGYYDSTFHYYNKIGHKYVTLGLAWQCQKVKTIPMQAHDKHLDFIITEKQIYKNNMQ